MSYTPPLSTELALRAFEADCAFSVALVAVQAPGAFANLSSLLAATNEHGFAWTIKARRVHELGQWQQDWQVTLRHIGGAEESATAASADLALVSLLGFPGLSTAQAPEVEELQNTHPAPEPLVELGPGAAAVAEVAPEPGPQVEQLEPEPATTPLTEQQQGDARKLVQQLNAEQRKAFTISFRDAFRVPREVKAIAPLITELQHLHFVDRLTIEMAGGVAP